MTTTLFIEQTFNGIQFGMMLFLMAAGVTLVFGVMRLINLAHGSMFMLGAYFAASAFQFTGSFIFSAIIAFVAIAILATTIEVAVIRPLYDRNHLDQVLATFGLTLFLNELVTVIWGREPLFLQVPSVLSGQIEIFPGVPYPEFRLAITTVAAVVGFGLYVLIGRTRLGMLIRAGADNRNMVAGLGVNIAVLYTIVFAIGAMLAGLAGLMTGPILTIQPGIGDPILILALTVIVIGGPGSIKGAFVASLLVGLLDTYGRIFLPQLLGAAAGNALASMSVYLLMAVVVGIRPAGLLGGAKV
jgi:branched-chain amino acid transport system permease protein